MDLVNRVFCIEKQYADWVKWQLRLPLVISGILGTVSLYLVRVDSPFVRTMGGFELALFSGMLLLGVAMYLRDVQLSRPAATHDKKLNDALDQALWSGVVVLIFYSMFRADVASGALFEEEAVSPRGCPAPQGFLGHLIAREFSQEECRDEEAR